MWLYHTLCLASDGTASNDLTIDINGLIGTESIDFNQFHGLILSLSTNRLLREVLLPLKCDTPRLVP